MNNQLVYGQSTGVWPINQTDKYLPIIAIGQKLDKRKPLLLYHNEVSLYTIYYMLYAVCCILIYCMLYADMLICCMLYTIY